MRLCAFANLCQTNILNEIEIKTERLIKKLHAETLGGVLLNSRANFAWLTGGKSNAINHSIENGACFLFVGKDGKRFVLSNNIEMPRILTEEISEKDFEPIEFSWQREKSNPNLIFEKAKSLVETNEEIASDLNINKEIRPLVNLIAKCRYELTSFEIERYKSLGKDAGIALGEAIKIITPNETEFEIARKVKNELAKFKIDAVVALVAADDRIKKYRHPVPTENIWKKVLLISICGRRSGLIANLTRMICAGEIPEDLKRKTEVCGYVSAKLLSETKAEKTGAELYDIAARAYAEKGFADEINKHHQGGATGYKTRDWVLYPKSDETVFPDQAFAFNPSIAGTKTEETAIFTDDRIEIITATPDFPQIIFEINGRKIFAPDILQI